MVKIGVLNLQGDVTEHLSMTRKAVSRLNLDIDVRSVRYGSEVCECDGIIISGGESTVIGKLIKERGIDKVIKNNKIPVLGTCAGMVLLSKKTDFNQDLLGLMDITVKRNSYGKQKDSFQTPIEFLGHDFLAVFIRAPAVETFDKSKIKVLADFDGSAIAIQQDRNIAISFHPELTNDTLIHEYFINTLLDNQM